MGEAVPCTAVVPEAIVNTVGCSNSAREGLKNCSLNLPYQDSCHNVRPVLQAICVVTAPDETCSGYILFVFIPVADLEQRKNECHK